MEIYDVIEQSFSQVSTSAAGGEMGSSSSFVILDCLAIGQTIQNGSDERVILFVKLPDGEVFNAELEEKIRKELRMKRTARHVPAKVCLKGLWVSSNSQCLLDYTGIRYPPNA